MQSRPCNFSPPFLTTTREKSAIFYPLPSLFRAGMLEIGTEEKRVLRQKERDPFFLSVVKVLFAILPFLKLVSPIQMSMNTHS